MDWIHGRFEARVRLPSGRGTWAGIWMMPTEGEPWPCGGEIDIVEHVGHDAGRIHGTLHTALCNHQRASQVGGVLPLSSEQWHTYGVEWTSQRIDFLCDGHLYFRIVKDLGEKLPELSLCTVIRDVELSWWLLKSWQEHSAGKEGWPFDKRFHLLMLLGGSLTDPPFAFFFVRLCEPKPGSAGGC